VEGQAPVDKPQDPVQPPPPPPPPPANNTANTTDAADQPPDHGPRKEAVVGDNVGRKGRNYGGGIITQPISSYFTVRDRIVMQQVDYNLKIFKAEHGRGPKSHEEFMEKVINANHLKLPEPYHYDDKFVYDPEKEMLMVESPKR